LVTSNCFLDWCDRQLQASAADDELSHRSVTSRAYYAAFHACDGAVSNHGYALPVTGNVGVHEKLIRAMKAATAENCPSKVDPTDVRVAGTQLATLKKLRARADYEIQSVYAKSIARDAYHKATQLVRHAATKL